MSLLDIDAVEDNFQHWDIILYFLKKYMGKKFSYISFSYVSWKYDCDKYNYKIYPFPINKDNNLYVFYTVDDTRSEVGIYFDKPSQSSKRNGFIDKPDGKRWYHLYYKGKAVRYNDLIEMIYECT
jgi:hypothetical protein